MTANAMVFCQIQSWKKLGELTTLENDSIEGVTNFGN